MLDADERAILFLCCERHVVFCPECDRDRQIRALRQRPADPDRWLCPKCRRDLSASVLEHAKTCAYFVNRKPLSKTPRAEPPAAATA